MCWSVSADVVGAGQATEPFARCVVTSREVAVLGARSSGGEKGTTNRRYVLFADVRREEGAWLNVDGRAAVGDTT